MDLVAELSRDTSSHLFASLERWAWVPAPGELLLTSLLEVQVNRNRDEKTQPTPFVLPRPWDEPDTVEPEITPDERAALIDDFQQRSAMRDL